MTVGTAALGYVNCDVIEGACTVDCGSAWRIVCDTGEWIEDTDDGALDVVVTIDEVRPSSCRASGQRGVRRGVTGSSSTIVRSSCRNATPPLIFHRPDWTT